MPAESEAQRRYLNAEFGHDWVKRHHFDNKGKLPEHVKKEIPEWANYRASDDADVSCGTCSYFKQGLCTMFDDTPVAANAVCDEWEGNGDIEKDGPRYTAEPADRTLEGEDAMRMALLSRLLEPPQVDQQLMLGKGAWEVERLGKAQAHPCELNLRVHGVTRHADSNMIVYRMDTRDGHYIGRTEPTHHRAVKGDILKVQANHVGIASNGDVNWMNANVISRHDGQAHSWKDLNAIADGHFEKNFAAGESAPDPGDGGGGGMPSAETLTAVGPTVSSVHVNRPLKNISVAYMGRNKKLEVKKADKHKQIIYGVVLEPNVIDSQDDYMLTDQVEKAAHTYMRKVARGQASVSKIQHRKIGFFKSRPSVVPVESFIAPCDFSYDGKDQVKKGTWVMALHVEDPNIWQQVMNGEFTGLSIGGTGIRREAVPQNDHMYMVDEPADWFSKEATPKDFSEWRDFKWEGWVAPADTHPE